MTSIPYFRIAVAIFMAVCLSLGGASLAASAPQAGTTCTATTTVRCPSGYVPFFGKCVKKSNAKCPHGQAPFFGKCAVATQEASDEKL